MSVILIFPPLSTALSSPPASLPALKTFLKLHQIEASVWDFNIEFVHYIMNNWDDFYIRLENAIKLKINETLQPAKRNYFAKILYIYALTIQKLWPDIKNKKHGNIELFIQLLFEIVNCYYFEEDQKDTQHLFWSKNTMDKNIDQILNDNFILQFFLSRIDLKNAKLVGLSFLSETQLPYGLAFAQLIKKINSDIKVVAGGPYITEITKEEKSTEFLLNFFDFLSLYEGETAIIGIYQSLNLQGLVNHPNILTKDKTTLSKIHYESLDLLPALDFGGLKLDLYFNHDLNLPFYSSKGCSWGRCTFCCLTGNEYREKKIELVIDDLKKIIEDTGIHHFQFVDENITPSRLKKISEALISNNINIKWFAQIRFDKELDYDTLFLMKQSGCYTLEFGLESGSIEVLKTIKKGISLTLVEGIIENCNKLGLEVILNCMIGFPDESMENALETIDFLDKITNKTSLMISCNTQIVKIYKTSRFIETNNLTFKTNLFSTIVDWVNPDWVPDFVKKYKDHLLLNRKRSIEKFPLYNDKPSIKSNDYYVELLKSFIYIEGVFYDFNRCQVVEDKINYIVIFNTNEVEVYVLNEVMSSIIHILSQGKIKVVELKKAFLAKYKNYKKEDALSSLTNGIIRLNEIEVISIY